MTLAATVFPQHGCPFRLDTTVRHELVADGLVVTHTITNRGPGLRAPFAVGSHPFFRVGDHDPATLTVTLDAATRYETNVRSIPVGTSAVAGTPFDLAGSPLLGDLDIDACYRDVAQDPHGHPPPRRLTAPDGSRDQMWQDASFPYVQIFTPRNFPRDGVKGLAFAAEPMTAPANALASGEGLIWLDEDETWSGSWGVRYRVRPDSGFGGRRRARAGLDGTAPSVPVLCVRTPMCPSGVAVTLAYPVATPSACRHLSRGGRAPRPGPRPGGALFSRASTEKPTRDGLEGVCSARTRWVGPT